MHMFESARQASDPASHCPPSRDTLACPCAQSFGCFLLPSLQQVIIGLCCCCCCCCYCPRPAHGCCLLWRVLQLMQVLIEAGQQLPDGRMRQRCLPLSEKMIGPEDWQAAAVRAVSEELATALPQEWRCQVSSHSSVLNIETLLGIFCVCFCSVHSNLDKTCQVLHWLKPTTSLLSC